MKTVVGLLLALAVAFTACGSTVNQARRGSGASDELSARGGDATNSDGADATDASGASSALGGSGARTLTSSAAARRSGESNSSVTGPIQIGIVRTGVSNAAAFGVSLGNTVTETDVYNAIISAFNDKGGVAGRKIDPVFDDTDTSSANWDADFEEVCQKFTQDNHVVAVLGYVFDYVPAFESCLNKKGIPHLSTSFNIPDTKELQQFPMLVALSTPRIDRRSGEKIDGAMATGVLTKASRLGVVLDQCPGTERAWNTITKPYLETKGITIASVFTIDCARGSGDAGAAAGQAGNLVLQFRTQRVDVVMVNGVSEGPALLILATAAASQQWHPKYVVSSLANAAVLGGQMPPDQAANVHGYGWMPVQDVNPAQWPGQTSSQQRCSAMVASKGLKLQSAADFSFAFNLCDALFVYERALTATGGRTAGPGVTSAIEAIGSSYVSALNLEGRATFSHSQHDAPALARYFAWDTNCSCFTYRATRVPIR